MTVLRMVPTLSLARLKNAVPPRYKQAGRSAYLRIASLTTAGSQQSCPCCGRRVSHFARFHGEQDQCPGCGSLMRHRALLLYLRDILRIGATGGRVLQVAPNLGVMRWLSSLDRVSVVSVDLSSPLAAVHADVTELPFEDDAFDLVICSHVLEHVPDDRKAIAELFRTLRPGGTAILQVPPDRVAKTFEDSTATDPRKRERLFDQYDHVRLCGPDYQDRIEEAGFEVSRVDYPETLDPARRDEFGLRAGEPFYVSLKP